MPRLKVVRHRATLNVAIVQLLDDVLVEQTMLDDSVSAHVGPCESLESVENPLDQLVTLRVRWVYLHLLDVPDYFLQFVNARLLSLTFDQKVAGRDDTAIHSCNDYLHVIFVLWEGVVKLLGEIIGILRVE